MKPIRTDCYSAVIVKTTKKDGGELITQTTETTTTVTSSEGDSERWVGTGRGGGGAPKAIGFNLGMCSQRELSPPPPSVPGAGPPPRRAARGMGGQYSIFWKTREIGLPS
jgi:hypothetical protein